MIISTHIVSDIEYIAAKNAVMKEGKFIAAGTTEELIQSIENKVWSSIIPVKKMCEYDHDVRIINVKNEDKSNVSIRYLADKPINDESVSKTPCLEDLYLWMFPQESY